MLRLGERGIPLSSMSPSFLHSNSTSHTTPFSAVAELIDNAADPGVSAQTIWIDVINEAGHLCLTFTDDGQGMTPSKLHKMLSFGFTDKGSGKARHQAIGIYGNGFKSGSMRLGRDALIFTKNGDCQTVGLLSQTYLENIKAQAVRVPIAPFSQHTKSLIETHNSKACLSAILQHSIVTSEKQLHTHFDSIGSKKGTKILIWNVRRDNEGKPEIDFVTDNSDFALPGIHLEELKKDKSLRAGDSNPDICYSLKAYLHILYLKPMIEIILRGEKIPAKQPSLTHVKHDLYNPHFSKEKARVTFGISQTKQPYGILMYHKNRLIKAYVKVGWQLMTSGKKAGIGVIGIVECNFLKPAHNKQDFEYTNEYRLTIATLGQKLNDYWKMVETVVKGKPQEQEFLNNGKDKIQHDALQEQPEGRKQKKSLEESNKISAELVVRLNRLKSVGLTVDESKPVEETSVVDQDMEVIVVDPVDHAERHANTNARLVPVISHLKQTSPGKVISQESFQQHEANIQTCDHGIGHKNTRNDTNIQRERKHVDVLRKKRKSDSGCGVMAKRFNQCVREKGDAFDQKTQRNAFNAVNSESPKTTVQSSEGSEQTSLPGRLSQSEGPQQQLSESEGPQQRLSESEGPQSLQRLSESEGPQQRLSESEGPQQRLSESEGPQQRLSESEGPQQRLSESEGPQQRLSESEGPQQRLSESEGPQSQQRLSESEGPQSQQLLSESEGPQSQQLLSKSEGPQSQQLLSESEGPQSQQLLSESEGPQSQQRLSENDQAAKVLKLPTVERGVQRPPADCSTGNQGEILVKRDVGCQTDMTECSSAAAESAVQETRDMPDSKELPELNGRQKNQQKVCDCGEDSRSTHEKLLKVRNNVVVLLTAILPQLDLSGIGLETSDVDNILQQIIEVNSLKM